MIDEVHQLSAHAFNAMLKTLEEPPDYVKFILATTDPQKVPVTVLSRCLQFNLKQMTPAGIAARMAEILAEEKIEADACGAADAGAGRARQHARRPVAARPGDRLRGGSGDARCGARHARRDRPGHARPRAGRHRRARREAGVGHRRRDGRAQPVLRPGARATWPACCTGSRWRSRCPTPCRTTRSKPPTSGGWQARCCPTRSNCITRSRCTAGTTCTSRRTSTQASP